MHKLCPETPTPIPFEFELIAASSNDTEKVIKVRILANNCTWILVRIWKILRMCGRTIQIKLYIPMDASETNHMSTYISVEKQCSHPSFAPEKIHLLKLVNCD